MIAASLGHPADAGLAPADVAFLLTRVRERSRMGGAAMRLPLQAMWLPSHPGRASRKENRSRRRAADPTRRRILDELIAARLRAGLTQQQVADRLRTTRSAISRLEGGVGCRPTLTTIENYALAVGCLVEMRLRPAP